MSDENKKSEVSESEEVNKSNSIKPVVRGERISTYNAAANVGRKANNTGAEVGSSTNNNVKAYAPGGRESTKDEINRKSTKAYIRAHSGPIRTEFSAEEKAEMQRKYLERDAKKAEDEMLEEEADGKREIVEGKEPLKKDPKKRWKELKKALEHNRAFMSLEEELEPDKEEPQQPSEGQPTEEEPSQAEVPTSSDGPESSEEGEPAPEDGQEMNPSEENPEEPASDDATDNQQPLEAVSAGDKENSEPLEAVSAGGESAQADDNGETPPDPQELIDALKEEGYSDHEIAYIVHGHHAPEVDVSKQAKANATTAMSGLELDNAAQMAQLEREHAKRTMDHDHEHKRRMADLEYQGTQKKQNLSDLDEKHRQRMLDLEYEHAQKTKQAELEQAMKQKDMEMQQSQAGAPDAEADKATKRELQQVEVQKKKLELKLREEEIKLELEFKKREHELKLKLMEQQMKDQAKQKSEISGVKHEQRLAEAKTPPAKKPLKKSEEGADE